MERRDISCPFQESNLDSSVIQLVTNLNLGDVIYNMKIIKLKIVWNYKTEFITENSMDSGSKSIMCCHFYCFYVKTLTEIRRLYIVEWGGGDCEKLINNGG
jgi:hypothetical protein